MFWPVTARYDLRNMALHMANEGALRMAQYHRCEKLCWCISWVSSNELSGLSITILVSKSSGRRHILEWEAKNGWQSTAADRILVGDNVSSPAFSRALCSSEKWASLA